MSSTSFSIANLLGNNDQRGSDSPIENSFNKHNIMNDESIFHKTLISNTKTQNMTETFQNRFLMKLVAAQYSTFYQNLVLKNNESESVRSSINTNDNKPSLILDLNTSE